MNKNWHNISFEETAKALNTNIETGLFEESVKKSREKFGENSLPEEKRLTKLDIFLNQVKNPLVYILVVAGLLALALKDFADAGIIFAVVFLNFFIGFFQENKTSKILAELKKIVKVRAFVIRGGNEKEVDQADLVPGDVIVLSPGSKVPADARLIESKDLNINEFALTGEWLPAKKHNNVLEKETPMADRDNMVYMGTIIESGKGIAIVTETGLNTEIGKVVEMVTSIKEEKTPYQMKVIHFSKILGLLILLFCFLIFIFGIATQKEFIEMLLTSVAVVVAAVPEGLPAAVTVTFAFGLQEILKKKGLVRKLIAAETLGSTSVIATDKTGTLTEAKMEVSGILTGRKELFENGIEGVANPKSMLHELHILALKVATWCSEAFIENPDDSFEKHIIRGRATDKALLVAGIHAGLDRRKLGKEEPKIDELTFNSTVKFSASFHKSSEKEGILYVLGAPEVIINKSNYLALESNGKINTQEKLKKQEIEKLKNKAEILASKGQRVLATSYKKIKGIDKKKINIEEEIKNLTFVGFISLHDPIRKDAKSAINLCQRAGMKAIIITGDHKLTAKAVASELGLSVSEKNILEGGELDKISDDELSKKVENIEIYCRVEPRHKTRIVEAWQKRGEIVAMTGDGVNDAPALKKANIGIALGSGTEAAKEASDLILLDDGFSVIITAVEEGRRLMDNVRKIITYLLTGGFTEIVLVGLNVAFRLPLPILPGQILWKNLIESTPPSMALTFEPEEKDIMDRKPEDPRQPLLNKEMTFLIFIIGMLTNVGLFGFFLWLWHNGFAIETIRSIMFLALAVDSFFYIFSCRNLRKNIWQYNPLGNNYVNATIVFGFLMLFVSLYIPFFQAMLKTVPLGLFEWSIVIIFAAIKLIFIEWAKYHFIKRKLT
jgi:Ca2+-transporting ATPase